MQAKFFTAPYCSICKEIIQEVKDLCKKQGIKLEIIDVKADTATANRYGIVFLPTLILFDQQGKETNRLDNKNGILNDLQPKVEPEAKNNENKISIGEALAVAGLIAAIIITYKKL
jgi:thiol-disulfide isomerase/thioredoxin